MDNQNLSQPQKPDQLVTEPNNTSTVSLEQNQMEKTKRNSHFVNILFVVSLLLTILGYLGFLLLIQLCKSSNCDAESMLIAPLSGLSILASVPISLIGIILSIMLWNKTKEFGYCQNGWKLIGLILLLSFNVFVFIAVVFYPDLIPYEP